MTVNGLSRTVLTLQCTQCGHTGNGFMDEIRAWDGQLIKRQFLAEDGSGKLFPWLCPNGHLSDPRVTNEA